MTDSPDRVYVGRIFTGSRAMPWAEAVAIGGARVVAIGRIGDVMSQAPQGAEVIELGSRLMSPAFEDAHIHVLEGSLFYLDCDLHDIPPERYSAAIAARAAELPTGAWLRGGGWSMAAFGPQGPAAQDLDVLTGDRPAYLTARDGHVVDKVCPGARLHGVAADEKAKIGRQAARSCPAPDVEDDIAFPRWTPKTDI